MGRAMQGHSEKGLRIGMGGGVEYGGSRALFHADPIFQHQNVIRMMTDQTEIVRNHQDGHVVRFCVLMDECHHVCTGAGIESCGEFISDQKSGFAGQCHGQKRALSLSSRKLMGIGAFAHARFQKADLLHENKGLIADFGTCECCMKPKRVGDLCADPSRGVERGHGFLKDHAERFSTDLTPLRFRKRQKVFIVQTDFSVRLESGWQ